MNKINIIILILMMTLTVESQAGETAANLQQPIIYQNMESTSSKAMSVKTMEDPKFVEDKGWQLGDPLSLWDGLVVFDIQLRWRVENRNNWIDFNEDFDIRDDWGLLQRLRLGMAINPVEWFKFYAQMQDSRTFFYDDENNPAFREFVTHDNPYDLHQAWVEFGRFSNPSIPWNLKVGRQKLNYEQQRLVGGFEWDNNARVFDAVKAQWRNPDKTVHLDYFAGFVVVPESNQFDGDDSSDLFMGLYNHNTWIEGLKKADFFVFYRNKSTRTPSTTFTNQDNQISGNNSPTGSYATLGWLFESDKKVFGPWDFNAEQAFQFGEVNNPYGIGANVGGNPINTGNQTQLAFASHIEGGYTFVDTPWTPRLFASYDFSTGDNNPNDGTSNVFQNLFPTNHLYYGYMDRFAWMNMHDVSFGVTAKPIKGLTLKLQQHFFWLANTNSPWFFAGQGLVGGAPRYANALNRNPSNYVGSELDLLAKYKVTDYFSILAGYSHFFTGDYISQTAPPYGGNAAADDADFVYFQVQLDF